MNRYPESPLITFNNARVGQYMERTSQTKVQVISKIMGLYGKECNQAAVNAEIDPIVDEGLRSHNRPRA